LRLLDDRREERSLISRISTSRMSGELSRRPINTTLNLAVIPVRNYEFASQALGPACPFSRRIIADPPFVPEKLRKAAVAESFTPKRFALVPASSVPKKRHISVA
jgi:hypothetical protein